MNYSTPYLEYGPSRGGTLVFFPSDSISLYAQLIVSEAMQIVYILSLLFFSVRMAISSAGNEP